MTNKSASPAPKGDVENKPIITDSSEKVNLIKRTELLRRNLLQQKPLPILRILLGSILVYPILPKKSTPLTKKFERIP